MSCCSGEEEKGEFKKRVLEAWKELDFNEEQYDVSLAHIGLIVEDAKKEFPIHFKMNVVSGGEYVPLTDSFTDQKVTTEYPKTMPLPQNKANAYVVKDEVIDWLVKWFGEVKP